MNTVALWKYQESLLTLMGALGPNRAYLKELDFARRMSKKFGSPYTINIIEVPLEKPPDRRGIGILPRN